METLTLHGVVSADANRVARVGARFPGIVKAVRDSDASSNVSTVDVSGIAAGRVVVVLAIAKEATGQSGSWGTARSSNGTEPRK